MPQTDHTKTADSEKGVLDEFDVLRTISGTTDPQQAFSRLMNWSQQAATRQLTADSLEDQLLKGGFELLRLLLQHHFDLRTADPSSLAIIEKDKSGKETRLGHHRLHTRNYESIFGTVKIQRTGFGARGIDSIHPLDEQLNLPKRRYSHPLQKRASWLCGRGPFSEAVEEVRQTTAANLPKRQMEQVVVEAASDFEAFYETRHQNMPPPGETGSILVAGIDCKGVPKRRSSEEAQEQRGKRLKKGEKKSKKKMATVASVHTTEAFVRTPEQVLSRLMDKEPIKLEQKRPRPEGRRLWASLVKSKAEVFEEVAQELDRRDPEREKMVVCVMDGEKTLKNKASEHLQAAFPGLILILDIIHVSEYLWKAAYAFFAEGSQEARNWVRKSLQAILEGGVRGVVSEMRESATKKGLSGTERKPVDGACKYFTNNFDRMAYDKYLAKGLPIGSGCVEGACGHLVKDRMELTGASWDVDGEVAEAVLKIRAIDKSGDFEEYWKYHLTQEKAYNYDRSWLPLS